MVALADAEQWDLCSSLPDMWGLWDMRMCAMFRNFVTEIIRNHEKALR